MTARLRARLPAAWPPAVWWPALAVASLALASSATSLANGFAYDDKHIIADNKTVHTLAGWWRLFADTYWPHEKGAALYRPLTILAFAVQWAIGGGSPLPFHALSVALYVAVSLAVLWLATAVLPRRAAWVAAALFAVHPVHVEAVGNVVGQAELLTALWCTLAVGVYVRARTRGPLTPHAMAGIAALYALACLSKEHGIVLPGLLLAAEATVVPDPRPRHERAAALRPFYLGLAALGLAFLWARGLVIGNFAGDDMHVTFRHATVGTRVLTMLTVAREWVRLLLWPARLSADYAPREIDVITGFGARLVVSVAVVLAVAWLAAVSYRRRPAATFGILFFAVAIFPVSNLVIPTGIVLAERTLFLPSVGAVLALGAAVPWVVERLRGAPPAAPRVAAAALAALLALGAWRSATRQRVWHDNPTLFRQTVLDAPMSYKAHWAWGMTLFDAKKFGSAEAELRRAVELYPFDSDLLTDFGNQYREWHICPPAIPLYEQALAIAPDRPDSRAGLIACLLEQARFREARSQARIGIARGFSVPVFRKLYGIADSVIVARGLAPRRATE